MDNKDASLHSKLCWPSIFHESYIKYKPCFSFPGFQKFHVLQFLSFSLLRMIVYAIITSVSTSVPPHPLVMVLALYLCMEHSLVSNLSVGCSMLVWCGYSAKHIYCLPKWMHVHSTILLEHNISSANMHVCTLAHVRTYALFYAGTHTHMWICAITHSYRLMDPG